MTHVRHLVHDVTMTQHIAPGGDIPALTLGWRLRMSLDHAQTSVQEMAELLGVSRTTLSRWMGDKGDRPKRAYLLQWALITGVPFEWIDKGKVTPGSDPGGGSNPVTRAGRGYLIAPVVTLRDQSGWPVGPKLAVVVQQRAA